jgi:hypothetical protein
MSKRKAIDSAAVLIARAGASWLYTAAEAHQANGNRLQPISRAVCIAQSRDYRSAELLWCAIACTWIPEARTRNSQSTHRSRAAAPVQSYRL